MKKSSLIILFFISIIICLSIAKAVVSNRLSIKGIEISKIEKEIKFYKTQNAILSEKFLETSSLTQIAAKAQKQGFAQDESLIVIKTSRSFAVRQ